MSYSLDALRNLGMQKLAQTELPYETGETYNYAPRPTVPISPSAGLLRAPSPQEAQDMDAYTKAALMGLLGGAATGVISGAVFPQSNILRNIALGAGTGAAGAVARHYEQGSEPPGLSPVYTIPGGLRTGAAIGGIGGGLASKFLPRLGIGLIPGIIGGLAAGGVGGALASEIV